MGIYHATGKVVTPKHREDTYGKNGRHECQLSTVNCAQDNPTYPLKENIRCFCPSQCHTISTHTETPYPEQVPLKQ